MRIGHFDYMVDDSADVLVPKPKLSALKISRIRGSPYKTKGHLQGES